jgi:hypothetical protein
MFDFTHVTIDPIYKNGWVFKVSAGEHTYGQGVLCVAFHRESERTEIKYFSDNESARQWVNDLASITSES